MEMYESEFPEVEKARKAFEDGRTLDLDFRWRQLSRLEEMLDDEDNRKMICDAMYKDLRKNSYESTLVEVVGVKLELQAVKKHFREVTKTKELPKNLFTLKDRSLIQRQPHGVTLLISPWNYPVYLTLTPLCGAIAAGNCCIIKPSELSVYTSIVIAKLVTQYLDNNCYQVILGGPDRIQRLLTHRFDHIFFTGSSSVGQMVLKAAAPHLTPCTLELGGKSPVYIDDSADLEMTVKRIMWGKLINVGQTCVAPDYILCSKKVQASFVNYARQVLKEFYGDNLKENKDICRLISTRHFQRLRKLVETTKGTIAVGGEMDEEDLYIEPTVVSNVPVDDSLMSEEIFGPVLPLLEINSAKEAIKFINARERPLALYIFTKDEKLAQHIIESTCSGTVCVNDVIFQVADLRLPFGGTGNSGMGNYHGKYSIETFSFQRAILKRELNYVSEKSTAFRYPPLTEKKLKTFEKSLMLKQKFELSFGPYMNYFLAAVAGYLFCLFISYFGKQ